MIIKHIPMRITRNSSFKELCLYITSNQGKQERVGEISITNCLSDQLDSVITEVTATQQRNTRAENDKTYHLIISFRPGEHPSKEVMRIIESEVCSSLGFAEHQRVSAVHYDTENVHIHVAINKIHPKRLTIHEPYLAYKTLAVLSTKLESRFGLEPDNHQTKKTLSEGRAVDMEHHTGIESLVTWIRNECLSQIKSAKSWDELNEVLWQNGLWLRPHGNGFVFESADGTLVKASTVDRQLSKPKLEQKYGVFQQEIKEGITSSIKTENASLDKLLLSVKENCLSEIESATSWADVSATLKKHGLWMRKRGNGLVFETQDGICFKASLVDKSLSKFYLEKKFGAFKLEGNPIETKISNDYPGRIYTKRPIKVAFDTSLLYAQYRNTQRQRESVRTTEWEKIKTSRKRLIDNAKIQYANRRKIIKHLTDGPLIKKVLYNQAYRAYIKEINRISSEHQKKRSKIENAYKRQAWLDWLRAEAISGNSEALTALRSRKESAIVKNSALSQDEQLARLVQNLPVDGVTKKGTVVYLTQNHPLRHNGESITLSPLSDASSVEAVVQEIFRIVDESGRGEGNNKIKDEVIQSVITNHPGFSFKDPSIEATRVNLIIQQQKENNEQRSEYRRGSNTGRRFGDDHFGRRELTDNRSNRYIGNDTSRREGSTKPGRVSELGFRNAQALGTRPPPQRRNSLHELSELIMVPNENRTPVLLQSDVSDNVEHQKTERDSNVRWPDIGVVFSDQQILAAKKYIAEREDKRHKGFDISEHIGYNKPEGGRFEFCGIRNIDNVPLVLLKHDEKIMVLPSNLKDVKVFKTFSIRDSVLMQKAGKVYSTKKRGIK